MLFSCKKLIKHECCHTECENRALFVRSRLSLPNFCTANKHSSQSQMSEQTSHPSRAHFLCLAAVRIVCGGGVRTTFASFSCKVREGQDLHHWKMTPFEPLFGMSSLSFDVNSFFPELIEDLACEPFTSYVVHFIVAYSKSLHLA